MNEAYLCILFLLKGNGLNTIVCVLDFPLSYCHNYTAKSNLRILAKIRHFLLKIQIRCGNFTLI